MKLHEIFSKCKSNHHLLHKCLFVLFWSQNNNVYYWVHTSNRNYHQNSGSSPGKVLIKAEWKKCSQGPQLNGTSWTELLGLIENSFSLHFVHTTPQTVCPQPIHLCSRVTIGVSLQSQLSWRWGFTLVDPLLSGHCVLLFNFSLPHGGYKPFWKLLSVSNFSAWLPRKKNQLIRKSSLGLPDRLRQGLVNLHLEKVFHTRVALLSLQGVSAVWAFTLGKLLC